MAKIEQRVEEIASKLLKKSVGGYELVDVEYVKEGRNWYLRIYIDKLGGIGLDDCQKFSELIEKEIDKENLLDNAYHLEVSSPGLDRILKKDRDFVRERGKKVDVTFYAPLDGEKSITGVLVDRNAEHLMLEDRDPIPIGKVAQVRLHVEF